MKESNHDGAPGPLGRIVRRFWSAAPLDEHTKSHRAPDSEHVVITCEGCGATSEVELKHGRDADNPSVSGGYFTRPCPHCGREQGAGASRRPF